MKEKPIFRICLDCKENKRTTVYPREKWNYYCETCLKKTAEEAYARGSGKATKKEIIIRASIVMIIATAGYALAWILCRIS